MNKALREKLLSIDRLCDEVLADCYVMANAIEAKNIKVTAEDINDLDDSALIIETVTHAQSTLSEIPLQYK